MGGQIFINYRRDDGAWAAGRLFDVLSRHFASKQIFIDVDNLDAGIDFIEAIEESVGSCDVLIAIIGERWLISSDEEGRRRLDNSEDFVRIEIATALKRGIRVIPVLVEGASMPRAGDLPDDLKSLVRRTALEVSHTRFRTDSERLIGAVERALEKAKSEQRQREKERLAKEYLLEEGQTENEGNNAASTAPATTGKRLSRTRLVWNHAAIRGRNDGASFYQQCWHEIRSGARQPMCFSVSGRLA